MSKYNTKPRRGTVIFHDMTPPTKAIDTPEGRICIGCGGDPKPLDSFPKTKGGRSPRCQPCINKANQARKKGRKADTFRTF